MLLPIEVLGASRTTESRTFVLQADQADSVRALWLQIHGLHYADQASVQVNGSAWIPLNNNSAVLAEPGKSFGGIGGGFATLTMPELAWCVDRAGSYFTRDTQHADVVLFTSPH